MCWEGNLENVPNPRKIEIKILRGYYGVDKNFMRFFTGRKREKIHFLLYFFTILFFWEHK